MARPKQSLAAVQLAKQKRAKAFNVDTPGTRAECFKYLESLLLDKTFGVAAEGMRSGKRKKLNFLHQLISVSTKRSSSSCFERVTNKTNIRKMFSSLTVRKIEVPHFLCKIERTGASLLLSFMVSNLPAAAFLCCVADSTRDKFARARNKVCGSGEHVAHRLSERSSGGIQQQEEKARGTTSCAGWQNL